MDGIQLDILARLGWPDWIVGLLLTAAWFVNATAVFAAGERRLTALLGGVELGLLLWWTAAVARGSAADSAVFWIWGNVLSSFLAGAALALTVRLRAGDQLRLGVARFIKLAWPLLILVGAANGIIALLRVWLLKPFQTPLG